MDDKRIAELEAQLKTIQEELAQAKKEKADEEWPKKGDKYYLISAFYGLNIDKWGADNEADAHRLKLGNVFRTKEDAQDRLDLLCWLAAEPDRWEKIKIWREMVECAEGFEPDWEDETERKYEIEYCTGSVHPADYGNLNEGTVYFRSFESAKDCISKIGADRLKRYWFGVKK